VADLRIEEVRDLDEAWPDLLALFLAFEDYNASFMERRLRPDWEKRWRESLALGPERLLLIARRGEDAVGYLNARLIRDFGLIEQTFAYVSDAFVHEEHRREGIGTSLLDVAEQWCRDRDATELRLDVWAGNEVGARFWQRSGFKVQSTTLRKSLAGAGGIRK
jgi:GNAT superfamily N-acetyltransferase